MNMSINRLILDKLRERDVPTHVKDFIRDVLQHERGIMDQKNGRYSEEYKSLLNQYIVHDNQNGRE